MGYLKEAIAELRSLRQKIGAPARAHLSSTADPLIETLMLMPEDFVGQRASMVANLAVAFEESGADFEHMRLNLVLAAMGEVQREIFMPAPIAELAYLAAPFPIAGNQTISHPQLVAAMSYAVARSGLGRALDVGTGSGYQAAVLSRLASKVVSIEIVEELGTVAADRLHRHGFDNIECLIGDACSPGFLSDYQFDAIIVAAGASRIPPLLLQHLSVGGTLVMPIGPDQATEQLVVVERKSAEDFEHSSLGPARFVPLTGHAERTSLSRDDGPRLKYTLGKPITPTMPTI